MKKAAELKDYLKEVSQKLASLPNQKPGNHYNSPTPTLGLSVPQTRACLKSGYSFLSLSPDAVLKAFDHVWNNAVYFEEMIDLQPSPHPDPCFHRSEC